MSLKEWRENQGLTQRQLADALDIHFQYLSEIERGRSPGAALAVRISSHTGGAVSLESLLGVAA